MQFQCREQALFIKKKIMCTIAYIKKEYFIVRKRVKPSDPILSISNGFHSFSSLERIKKSGPLIGTIVECLIPAGSKIVTGIDKGLIVSDQIIITDVIAHI